MDKLAKEHSAFTAIDNLKPGTDEANLEYLQKIDWLWKQLSDAQRSRIRDAVMEGTLKQHNGEHCINGNALGTKNTNPVHTGGFMVSTLARIIFYDGPSYDGLVPRKLTGQVRKIVDVIYYARIGGDQHQYERANRLIYNHVCQLVKSPSC